jgi:hypothetical protein
MAKSPENPRKRNTVKKSSSIKTPTVTPIDQGGNGVASQTQLGEGLQEQIRQRAYELYEERGRQHGFEQEDWSRAEAEILAKYRQEKSA